MTLLGIVSLCQDTLICLSLWNMRVEDGSDRFVWIRVDGWTCVMQHQAMP